MEISNFSNRYNTKRLTRILSEKSEELKQNDGMPKMKNFKFFALSHIDNFKGATSSFSELKKKNSNKMKLEVYPRELNFNSIELCSPMYKNFTLKNLDKQKNIEIASIVPESSQVMIEHDFGSVSSQDQRKVGPTPALSNSYWFMNFYQSAFSLCPEINH